MLDAVDHLAELAGGGDGEAGGGEGDPCPGLEPAGKDDLARMGGDEFTALLDLEFPEQAAKIAEKLIERVSICQQIEGLDIALGASIGIALYPDDGTDNQQMMKAADSLMYLAKQQGKGCYRFSAAGIPAQGQ